MLEGIDAALLEQLKQENAEFRRLLAEHQEYETQLDAYNKMRYLNSEQEVERKRLQKLKLMGKDRMLTILDEYNTV